MSEVKNQKNETAEKVELTPEQIAAEKEKKDAAAKAKAEAAEKKAAEKAEKIAKLREEANLKVIKLDDLKKAEENRNYIILPEMEIDGKRGIGFKTSEKSQWEYYFFIGDKNILEWSHSRNVGKDADITGAVHGISIHQVLNKAIDYVKPEPKPKKEKKEEVKEETEESDS